MMNKIIVAIVVLIVTTISSTVVNQRIMAMQLEEYRQSNEERILEMKEKINVISDDVKFLVRRQMK